MKKIIVVCSMAVFFGLNTANAANSLSGLLFGETMVQGNAQATEIFGGKIRVVADADGPNSKAVTGINTIVGNGGGAKVQANAQYSHIRNSDVKLKSKASNGGEAVTGINTILQK